MEIKRNNNFRTFMRLCEIYVELKPHGDSIKS